MPVKCLESKLSFYVPNDLKQFFYATNTVNLYPRSRSCQHRLCVRSHHKIYGTDSCAANEITDGAGGSSSILAINFDIPIQFSKTTSHQVLPETLIFP